MMKSAPNDNHVKFLTWYDYHARFGLNALPTEVKPLREERRE